jgi:hypothetical protein
MWFGGSLTGPPLGARMDRATVGRRPLRRRVAAGALAFVFVFVSLSPALPTSAAPVSASLPTASAGSLGSASSDPSPPLPNGPAKSALITDDAVDLPARVVPGRSAYDHFGSAVVSVGDLNGDGAGDLAVLSRSPWAVNILLGAPSGISSVTQVTFKGGAGELFGVTVAGGGDLNGDGYGDFAVTVGRPNSLGEIAFEVQVFYGASVITSSLQRSTIAPPAAPATFGSGLALLGDVDGDYLGDLLVSAGPGGASPSTGTAWIFAGERTGVHLTADWSYSNEEAGIAFGASATSVGDLNRDGLSDFAVTTGGQAGQDGLSRVFMFYGASGLEIPLPTVLVGDQVQDGFGTSIGSGDFDGDGVGDLLVGAPGFDPSSEQTDAGRVVYYRGTRAGLSSISAVPFQGASAGARFGAAVAGVGDVSGDGVDDAGIGAPLDSANGPVTNGQFFLYFGGSSGFSRSYDMTEAGEVGNDLFGASVASKVDLDGEGRPDIALGAPGREASGLTDAGSAYLYSGLRIRLPALAPSAFAAPDLVSGRALARAEMPYHLAFTFVYRGPTGSLRSVEETITSSAMNKAVTAYFDFGGQAVATSGSRGLVELFSDSSFTAGSAVVHSFVFTASVKFAWAFLDPNPVPVDLRVQDQTLQGTTSTSAHIAGAFTVVSALTFSRPFTITPREGPAVKPGGYARAGTTLAWSGGGLAYAAIPVVPPASEVKVFVVNEAGEATRAGFDALTGDIYVEKPLKSVDDPADLHYVRAMSQDGTVLAEFSAIIRIDGQGVAFGATSPRNGDTVTESTYPVTIDITDAGIGVDGSTVEWSVSHENPPVFRAWQSAPAASGAKVTASADVPLVESGSGVNFVSFRACDLVGNALAYSAPLQIRLDYGAVDFAMLSPAKDSWQRDGHASLSFEVRKDGAPFLDLASLEYELSTPTSTGWRGVGLGGESDVTRFTVPVVLPDGSDNQVRLRTRLTGLAAEYLSAPFHLLVDSSAPSFEILAPSPDSWVTGGLASSVVRVSDAVSGVAAQSVEYRFLVDGSNTWSAWNAPELTSAGGAWVATGLVPVNDGVENFVVWQASDNAGNGPAMSPYERLLADSGPVSFAHPQPADGTSAESISRLAIEVSDGDGSGVDLASLEYRVDMPGGLSTGWLSAGRSGIATRVSASVPFVLPQGDSSVRWRAHDAALTATTESSPAHLTVSLPTQPSRAPHLILTSPLSAGHYRAGSDIRFDASDSFDPAGAPLFFTWSVDGAPERGRGSSFWMQLAPGTHTVTLVVSDGTASPDVTIAFVVDPPAVMPGVLSSPLAQAAVASLAGLLLCAFAVRLWDGRLRRALSS